MLLQGASRGQGIGSTRTDRKDVVVRLDDLPLATHQEQVLAVGHHQKCVQPVQIAVRPPVLGQLYHRPREVGRKTLDLCLQPLEQSKGIGHRAGEPAEYLALLEDPDLLGGALHDGVAQRHLPVTTQRNTAVKAHRHDGRRSHMLIVHDWRPQRGDRKGI